MANDPVAVHSDLTSVAVIRRSLLSIIPHVSDEEILQAFASTTLSADQGADASPASMSASLRSLNVQNNVLFRMLVHSKLFQARSTGMVNGRCYLLLCVCHTSRRFDFVHIFVFVDVCWVVTVL